MTMLRGYRISVHGNVEYRWFDSSDFPDGWYDSPSKIPNAPPERSKDTSPSIRPMLSPPDGTIYGEQKRGGWPRGVSRSEMAGRK